MKDFSVKTRITNIIFEKKKPCYLVYINTKGLNLKTSYEFHNKYHEFSCCIHYAPYTYRLSLDLSK